MKLPRKPGIKLAKLAPFLALCATMLLFLGCWQGEKAKTTESESRKAQKTSAAESRDLSLEVEAPTLPPPSDLGVGKATEAPLTTLKTSSGDTLTTTGSLNMRSRSRHAFNDSEDEESMSSSDVEFFEPKNGTLIVLAGLCLVAGVVVAVWLKQAVLGIALGAAGICLFGLLYYPWLGAIALVIGIGMAVYFIRREVSHRDHGEKDRVIDILVRSIERLPANIQEAVKTQIQVSAGDADGALVKRWIQRVKERIGVV